MSFCGLANRLDVTDRSGQADRDRQVDAGNRQQALYCRIINCRLGEGAIEAAQILAEPVELAQMALDGVLLILGQRLLAEPCSPLAAEQVGMRARRDQMGMQDGMHLILDPGAMANHLVAPVYDSMNSCSVAASGNQISGRNRPLAARPGRPRRSCRS